MPIRVVVKGGERSAQQLEKLSGRLRMALIRAVQDSAITVQSLAKIKAPVFRGALRESIFQTVKDLGNRIVGSVGSPLVYAEVVESGRASGWFPPIEELKVWARRKLGDERKAFVVGRAIKQRGFRPQPYLTPAVREALPRIQLAFANRLNQAIQAEGGRP